MCVLCWDDLYRHGCPCGGECPKWNGDWTAPCSKFYQESPCYDSKLFWLEEARHSDIPNGTVRAIIDGPNLIRYILESGGKLVLGTTTTPYDRMFRHPKVTGRWTTQETLSFLD